MLSCDACRQRQNILYMRIVDAPNGDLMKQMVCIGCLSAHLNLYLDEKEELEALR